MRYAYPVVEMTHLALAPARALSDVTRVLFKHPVNPWTYTAFGRNVAASAELFERMTRRYGKPVFGLDATTVDGRRVPVIELVAWVGPFCRLLNFKRADAPDGRLLPKLLIVAPMSGHYATLLRGTVDAFLPSFDVYVTDWADARMVPMALGPFDLDSYVEHLVDFCRLLAADGTGAPVHTLGVCQPAVPLMAAVALMEARDDPAVPASMVLMGGPIDTRNSPTAVNRLAEERGTEWFERNCIETVPFPYPGMGRQVYPGFLQLSGFMAMNFDRHMNAHFDMFRHLVAGDGDSAEKHREFYDEYMAVMDLTAEFYMQTVDTVFVRHLLPKGELRVRKECVDPGAIRRTALMTVEGEKDDISGVGQTFAAHDLCPALPESRKRHHLQLGVGHYGVFNGSRFRAEIAPRIVDFTREMERAA